MWYETIIYWIPESMLWMYRAKGPIDADMHPSPKVISVIHFIKMPCPKSVWLISLSALTLNRFYRIVRELIEGNLKRLERGHVRRL